MQGNLERTLSLIKAINIKDHKQSYLQMSDVWKSSTGEIPLTAKCNND